MTTDTCVNVYVKVPVTDTRGESSWPPVRRLPAAGAQLNVTTLMTAQVAQIAACLAPDTPSFLSLLAGRAAGTGRNALPMMQDAFEALTARPKAELIWASPARC